MKMDDMNYGLCTTPTHSLEGFVEDWVNTYKKQLQKIRLFQPLHPSTLSKQQKTYFVKAFYHIRGHFHDFLWFMGNHAPSKEMKSIVLNNIAEEFGGHCYSHEQLYAVFASKLDVDIVEEIINCDTYEPYILEFNKGHLRWLNSHNWPGCLSAFAAYECLDNIDYPYLIFNGP